MRRGPVAKNDFEHLRIHNQTNMVEIFLLKLLMELSGG